MSRIDGVRDWYLALAVRERRVVTAGAAVLALIVLWLAIIAPWLNAKASLNARIEADARLLTWMRQTAATIKQLERTAPAAVAPGSGQSLFATVEQTAQLSPVGAHIKQFQPRGDRGVQVRLEAAPFDALIAWLGDLQAHEGVLVTAFSVQQADAPGTVDADVTLERPAP